MRYIGYHAYILAYSPSFSGFFTILSIKILPTILRKHANCTHYARIVEGGAGEPGEDVRYSLYVFGSACSWITTINFPYVYIA